MVGEEHPDLVASWKAERRWFRWTVGFAAGMSLGIVGWIGVSYWAYLKFEEFTRTIAAARTADVAAMESRIAEVTSSASPVLWVGAAIQILLVVSALGFLISLVKWLLAIRDRRAIHGRAFPHSGR
jgi:hypothetical protein